MTPIYKCMSSFQGGLGGSPPHHPKKQTPSFFYNKQKEIAQAVCICIIYRTYKYICTISICGGTINICGGGCLPVLLYTLARMWCFHVRIASCLLWALHQFYCGQPRNRFVCYSLLVIKVPGIMLRHIANPCITILFIRASHSVFVD